MTIPNRKHPFKERGLFDLAETVRIATQRLNRYFDIDQYGAINFDGESLPNTQTKYKTSTTAIDSAGVGATLTDDGEIAGFSLLANSIYKLEAYFRFSAETATPDVKWVWQFSQTPQATSFSADVVQFGGTLQEHLAENMNTTVNIALTSTSRSVNMAGYLVTHATADGTLDFQWAQNTSSADDTSFFLGSWAQIQRMGPA